MRVWFGGGVLAIALVVLPTPALERGVPHTLAATSRVGSVAGVSAVIRNRFPIDFAAVSWSAGDEPAIRFLSARSRWSSWVVAHQDELPSSGGRTYSALVPANDAVAVQVRGANDGVRIVAINTTDGPRPLRFAHPEAQALTQPSVVTRAQWGADESYRFNTSGTEEWPQAFYATKKLVVHHTATANDDA
ncbi:MAG: hypothetical protein ABR548_05880, partial [Actinomycetota bacterium]